MPTISKYLPDKTIVFSAISKCHGAGGWRLGFCIVPDALEDVKQILLKVGSETYSAVAAPIQYACLKAYEIDNPDLNQYKRDSTRILQSIGYRTVEKLNSHGVKCHQPDGGFYTFVDFSNYRDVINSKLGTNSSTDFCRIMLEQTGVSLLSGGYFNTPDQDLNARLAFIDFNGEQILSSMKTNPSEAANQPELAGAHYNPAFLNKHTPNCVEGVDKMCEWLD